MDPQSVNSWSGDYIDSLYSQWQSNPEAVAAEWHQFFKGFDLGMSRAEASLGSAPATEQASSTNNDAPAASPAPTAALIAALRLQRSVDSLIEAYRLRGHLGAQLDPLGTERPFPSELALESFGLADEHLQLPFDAGTLPMPSPSPLGEILSLLEETYCRSIGVELAHLDNAEQRRWLQKRMEACRNKPRFSNDAKQRILQDLQRADGFESFLAMRYVGKKRFGIEGAEAIIAMLGDVIECSPGHGVDEIVVGMAHRGRVNVLAHAVGKRYEQILTEFDEAWEEGFAEGGGDVKYHQGHSGEKITSGGQKVHVTVSPNASHLEYVNSIILGRARAKQDRILREDRSRAGVLALLIHGDAALPGQGIVSECLNMARLDGYSVAGTLHLVLNNQVGFTTDHKDLYSGTYCTDIALAYGAPVIHVNADDPEAAVWAMRLAYEFRQAFGRDFFIDLWCWRKHGHNESDDPDFTQPLLYQRVRAHKPSAALYTEQLVSAGVTTAEAAESFRTQLFETLDKAQALVKRAPVDPAVSPFNGLWKGFTSKWSDEAAPTAVDAKTLEAVAKTLGTPSNSIKTHKTVQKVLALRAATCEGAKADWGTAEALAIGTLLLDGHDVRLTGQDVERGTFSHRHAVTVCQTTGAKDIPLTRLDSKGCFTIHNSPLTEIACVGFEYGYSLVDPQTLVIWEAQFGDFANAAQVIIDQFLCSAEVKWSRSSGLVLLLPHGYEGQGPEHSSARLERFVQNGSQENIQVCAPTTSAQYFHLLRRQVMRNFRKPLIVMSPKSMLRLPAAASSLAEMSRGTFQTVLADPTAPKSVERLVFCSGKFFHELDARRAAGKFSNFALVRLEQLYPFPQTEIAAVLEAHPHAEICWAQEEPENAGAWRFIRGAFIDRFGKVLRGFTRPASATPAVGSSKVHAKQAESLLALVFESPLATPAAAVPSTHAPAVVAQPSAAGAAPEGESKANDGLFAPTKVVDPKDDRGRGRSRRTAPSR
ncbi:MAG: 2-oxoglutarate dehydrogenase E1 component [Phycisphaerales bacterium]|nr:2-oxoglutarate dehydrogenase E1 component [Phycisphaerales bacterium]